MQGSAVCSPKKEKKGKVELVERKKLRKLLFHFAFYNNKRTLQGMYREWRFSRFNSKRFAFIFIIFIHCDIHYNVNCTFRYFSYISNHYHFL